MSDEQKGAPVDQTVPFHRFQQVNDKRSAAEARIVELEAELQRLTERAATADTLAQQVQEWQTRAEQAQTGLTEYQAAARIGVTDPELYEAARWAHSRMPEADRPAFADALQAWKEDPSAAPLVLRPHLAPAPAAAPQAAQPAPAQQGQPAPSPNNGAEAFPSAPKALDVLDMSIEQYRAQRDRFKGTSLI